MKSEDWKNAGRDHSNLSELHLTLGNISKAVAAARNAGDFADRSEDEFLWIVSRTTLADALDQSGDVVEAERLFAEAEWLQAERQPEYPILYSLRGYRYCDLLLSQGQNAEVLRRTSRTLRWAEGQGSLITFGLEHLSPGRAHPVGSKEAEHHLDQAIDFLRRSGTLDHLPPRPRHRPRP